MLLSWLRIVGITVVVVAVVVSALAVSSHISNNQLSQARYMIVVREPQYHSRPLVHARF